MQDKLEDHKSIQEDKKTAWINEIFLKAVDGINDFLFPAYM